MRFTSDIHHTVKEDTSKTKYDRLELDVCGGTWEGLLLPYQTPPPPHPAPSPHRRSLPASSASGQCFTCMSS